MQTHKQPQTKQRSNKKKDVRQATPFGNFVCEIVINIVLTQAEVIKNQPHPRTRTQGQHEIVETVTRNQQQQQPLLLRLLPLLL
jgi:hypothetical protein